LIKTLIFWYLRVSYVYKLPVKLNTAAKQRYDLVYLPWLLI